MSDDNYPEDPGVGYNPAQRPHRHPAGRSCPGNIVIAGALLTLLVKVIRKKR